MATKKKGLGKGLANLYGESIYDVINELENSGNGNKISLDKIRANPYQPRAVFNEEGLKELADSIATHGVFTPILVRAALNGYELIAGERRVRAAKLAGIKEIPAIIAEFTDQQMMEISLLENIQRENLSAIEEAVAYKTMIDKLGYTQETIAERVNKSRSHITNLLRLLKLPKKVQNLVINGKLTGGHVRPLITLSDRQQIEELADKIVKEDLSVRQVEALVQNKTTDKKTIKPKSDYGYAEQLISNKLQTAVKVTDKQIVIKYKGDDDLNRLLELMDCLED